MMWALVGGLAVGLEIGAHGAVEGYRLADQHGIGIADGRQRQAVGVLRRRRRHDLHAAVVYEVGFDALRMPEPALDAAE